jgi:hypothetical protein
MAANPNVNGEPAPGTPGWAVVHEANWSYKPALIATILGIILFPALFLIGYLPHTNDPKVVYPALRQQMIGPHGALEGQPPTPQAGP